MKMIDSFIRIFYNNNKKENYIYCRRCGRKLRTKESRKLGLGKCCYKKEICKNKLF